MQKEGKKDFHLCRFFFFTFRLIFSNRIGDSDITRSNCRLIIID